MEELRPEDIEDLLQELEEEHGAQEAPPPGVEQQPELEEEQGADEAIPPDLEKPLSNLQSAGWYFDRAVAAEQLARASTSSRRIVRALIHACRADAHDSVRGSAAKALRAPVHQAYLQQHPDLREAAVQALLEVGESDSAPQVREAAIETLGSLVPQEPLQEHPDLMQRVQSVTEQMVAQREKQRAWSTPEQHTRREPMISWKIYLPIAFGIVWVGIVAASGAAKVPCLFGLVALPGAAVMAWGLWSWRSATTHRDVLLRSTRETVGTITELYTKEHEGEYGSTTTYHVTVRFEADDTETAARVIELKADVARHIWDRLKYEKTVGIRYAAEDPSIALIEGEW